MAEFYYGNDLYNDLFLNNNRELYIKIFLLDLNEPEIDEFYVRDADIAGGGTTALATKMIVPYSEDIVDGDSISLTTIDLDAFRGTGVSWGNTFGYNITNRTFTGKIGNNYATINNSDEISAGMTITCAGLFSSGAKITSLAGTTIYFDRTINTTATNATSTIYTNKIYGYLNTSNFYINSLNTFYSITKSSMWGIASSGKYYKSNRFNKILVSTKEVQGSIISGSLKVDGNSPMRRTIDFSCIVPREFQKEKDLRLSDFDNKKIKILIGIKDSILSTYDYSQYFTDNGTQKDLKDIVWFKMGTFIPRNVNIRHSVDSFQVSITAQDKMSSLDGSFGGVLGVGKEFRNPVTGLNTSFYDTIIDGFEEHTKEKTSNIEVSFTDPYGISKLPPSNYSGNFVTSGSTLMRIQDSTDLYLGMEIEAPGVYKGTKIAGMSQGPTFANIFMDYIAFSTIPSNQTIVVNNKSSILKATFSNPSYKDFFAIQPLVTLDKNNTMYMKQTTISFKNSTYSYGAAGNIYTTIADWAPNTWGSVLLNEQKPYYKNSFLGQDIVITGQDATTDSFTSKSLIEIGDILFSGSDVGSLQLTPYRFYYVTDTLEPGKFKLGETLGSATSIDVTTTVTGQEVSLVNYNTVYQSSIFQDKTVNDISYGNLDSAFRASTNAKLIGSISGDFISKYNSYSNSSSQQTLWNTGLIEGSTKRYFSRVAISNDKIYVHDSMQGAIFVDDYPVTRPVINSVFGSYTPLFILKQFSFTNDAQGIANFTLPNSLNIGDCVVIGNLRNNTGLGENSATNSVVVYYINSIVSPYDGSNGIYTLKDESGNVIKNFSNQGLVLRYIFSKACINNIYSNITKMVCNSAGELITCSSNGNIVKYGLNNLNQLKPIQEIQFSDGYTLIDVDSSDFLYALSTTKNSLIKINPDFSKGTVLSRTLSGIWGVAAPLLNFTTYPIITSISVDNTGNLFLVTGGTYMDGATEKNTNVNFIVLNPEDLSNVSSIKYFDNLGDYSNCLIGNNNVFFYPRNESPNIKLTQFPLLTPFRSENVNAIREFSPQTDSTIVKDNSEKVSSILEDVKNQLGSYQYYYDADGRFVFKEDKRLSYVDDDYSKTLPYDLIFDDYNINTGEIPIIFDFIKNNEIVLDYANNTDLSAFKNDFLIYGSKKGIEESATNTNTTILYHVMVDDLKIKNIPSGYYNPWQQYIIDQGNLGTTYANFEYYRELKEWFEFVPSRDYAADPSLTYVPGEFILVNNTLAGASSTSSYSLYEVITGGTPSTGVYPFKKDGTQEWLNTSLDSNTGLSVKFYKSAFGSEYKKHQGVYSKFFILENKSIAIRPGSYFIGTAGNNQKYIYQISNIYYYDQYGTKIYFGDSTPPISINLYNNPFDLSNMYIIGKESLDNKLVSYGSVDLGILDVCYVDIINIASYTNGNQGVFRSENTGVYKTDFSYSSKPSGDPGSWTYFFDVINIIGRYEKDLTTGVNSPVQIAEWASFFNYQTNDLVYSDGKIYQAIIGGISGATPPEGYGDEDNLIKDVTVAGSKLTWKLNQISANMERLKVSAVGSRKASLFDKDINILFSPKEALAFFTKSGYYLFVIDDYLGYETYSETFHRNLEYLIRQFTKLYPDIKIVFVPESQIQALFTPNKLTALKSALASMKKNLYLSFIGGQSISINSIPIYTLEPLNIIKVSDEQSEIYGDFLLTDLVLPLSNEGPMSINAVKTHPYDDRSTVLPATLTNYEKFSGTNIIGNTVFQ